MKKEVVAKMYFSIKEVAGLIGETEPTLRYWESEFPDVISPRRNEHGTRFYSEKDLEDIRLVKYLIRENGLTLEGARKKIKNNKDNVIRQAKIFEHLKHIRSELKALRKAMDEVAAKGRAKA